MIQGILGECSEFEAHTLISHFAVDGSINNDGSRVSSKIGLKSLKRFKNVLLGHYHDNHTPLPNVYHMPSLIQHNFGEDKVKGYTLLENGEYKHIQSEFVEYTTTQINLDEITTRSLNKAIKDAEDSVNYERFSFSGSPEKLLGIDHGKYQSKGIAVVVKGKKVTEVDVRKQPTLVKHTSSSVKEAFDAFCSNKGIDSMDIGLKYLNKKLDG